MVKKLSLVFVLFVTIGMIASCGGSSGSGGGGGSDLSCAPDSPSDPTYDLSGTWDLAITITATTCPEDPGTIDCSLTFSQTGNDITVSGSCLTGEGISVAISSMSALLSGSTLYWGGTLSGSAEGYSETDTIPCTSVAMLSDHASASFTGLTISVQYSVDGTPGSCQSTVSGQFTGS